MSYTYSRERDWDDSRPVSIKRYVIPAEDDRRDFMSRHDDYAGERELVIRRKADRSEPMTISRYEREVDYEPPARRFDRDFYERESLHPSDTLLHAHHTLRDPMDPQERVKPHTFHAIRERVLIRQARDPYSPRESDYNVVRRSEADEDPYYYHRHRRVREYDDRRSRRELSPGDSISQASHRRGDRDQDYSSDDSMVYIRKETRDYDDHPHHRRHLAEGALVGAGAAELIRSHRKRDGEEVSDGASRLGKTLGAGALGAVAVNAASHARDYYRRSKSRHRSHSFDDERSSHHHSRHSRGRHHSRSRSRSHSHSRAKTLLELGVGAAAVAAGVAALRSKSNNGRKSRSRTRSRSRAASRGRSVKDGKDASERSMSERRKHMAGAGLAGAAVAGLVEKVRSHSRSRKGERSRSRSRLRQALPIAAAGLATAAATGLYEKKKGEKDKKDGVSRGRHRSRSRSRAPSESFPDPARDSAGLIEYGNHPVAGSIPAEHYYGAPASPGAPYYSDGHEAYAPRRHSRSRSRSRGGRYSSSDGSDREHRRHRSKKHRSRSRDIASAALGATGLGYAAHKYSQRKDREKSKEREHSRYDHDPNRDPYEESYDPEPYPPSPHAGAQAPPMGVDPHYYPNSNYFPPPPGDSTHNLNTTPAPYHPADYPPPPGAAPQPQPYSYGAVPPGPGMGPETYAPRPRRADENVSPPSSNKNTVHDGLKSHNPYPPSSARSRSNSQPAQASSSKSVAFDLTPDKGYETDDSNDTVGPDSQRGGKSHRHHHRRRSSSVPHSPVSRHGPTSGSRSLGHHQDSHSSRHHDHRHSTHGKDKASEPDSDSTEDLPDRFDSHGRLIQERDPALEKFEDLVNRFSKVLF
ncbi:hypothetical protein N7460_002508 [Penicillium canescens]|uniref:DUF3824 domain-containing protein n=1 Tax=Penicillium canescens TaxID=5083 RepID=A0AAD6NCN0_PENCN|nr:hypothetical protein N7460_002508 [Penicillium canescens]KAJ6065739.1 hypothetical protein N7444_001392 [Penicillium canescens]